MISRLTRRRFHLTTASLAASTIATPAIRSVAASPNEQVVVGVMGLSRGRALALAFHRQPNVWVKYVLRSRSPYERRPPLRNWASSEQKPNPPATSAPSWMIRRSTPW